MPQKYSAGRQANVAKVCNFLNWRKPLWIDGMVSGYRVTYDNDLLDELKEELHAEYFKNLQLEIQKGTGLVVKFRKRSGYGFRSGMWDMIIPQADAEHEKVFYTNE